jgi:hypothetical protein
VKPRLVAKAQALVRGDSEAASLLQRFDDVRIRHKTAASQLRTRNAMAGYD